MRKEESKYRPVMRPNYLQMYLVYVSNTYSQGRLNVLQLVEDPPSLLWTHDLQLLPGHTQEHGAAQHAQAAHRAGGEMGVRIQQTA